MSTESAASAQDPDVQELGRYAVLLARGAAELVLERTRGHGRPDAAVKSTSTDLVTEIDRASERWLLDRIGADRPGDAVLGEETGGHGGSSRVRWVIDPIDGTVNFVLGLPEYAVSVAAERNGVVVAGAVCSPVPGELFSATRGGGAWLSNTRDAADQPRRLNGPRSVPLDRAVVGTGFGYERGQRSRQGAVAAQLIGRVGDIRRIGSAALDLCSVAAGRLDAYYEVGLSPWDLAAGALIAEEAGCQVQAHPGRLTAAAGAELAPKFFALLAELGAADVLA